jgi:hypothetical protein
MKKLLINIAALGLAASMYAQGTITVPLTLITAGTCTNLYDGGCLLYEISFDLTASTVGANSTFRLFDSPKTQIPRSGTATSNGIEYTNTGYTTYSYAFSNMNWLAAGSQPILGVNSNVNAYGVVTTFTNSSVLSNYLVTVTNTTAASALARPIRTMGIVQTNTITTYTFDVPVAFTRGITLSNTPALGASTATLIIKPSL